MEIGQIFPGSSEWNYLQFRLQLLLAHPNVEIVTISKNSLCSQFFPSEKSNYFKIDSALDVTQFKQTQIQQLKNNSKKSQIFKCGKISQQPRYFDSIGNAKIFRILLFKIAIKEILSIYKDTPTSKEDLLNFTDQYDSIYLANKSQQMAVYDHTYLLKSSSQYVWQYDIQYCYVDPNTPKSKLKRWLPQNFRCEQCLESTAYWYCPNDKQIFCRDCYEQTHKGRTRTTHKKELITPFNCFKKCQISTHQKRPKQFYCFDCKETKCQYCLRDPLHLQEKSSKTSYQLQSKDSSGNKSKQNTHKQVQIAQLAQLLKIKQKQLNSELKLKLTTKIKQVEGCISLIEKDFKWKMEEIQSRFKQEILILRQQNRREVNKAVSVHNQLKRKFDQVLWIEKFVEYNQKTLDAESNIRLKESFAAYIEFMNANEYFTGIDRSLQKIRKHL